MAGSAIYRVYVLRNTEARFYIGLSEDVLIRLRQHNEGKCSWTSSRGPWSLVWTSPLLTLTQARKLENRLKRQKGGLAFHRLTGLPRLQSS